MAQKQALELQAQVITHQKAKAEVQTKLDQALKELELAKERESKLANSVRIILATFFFFLLVLIVKNIDARRAH